MIVEMDRKEVLERAERALDNIHRRREIRVAKLIEKKIKASKKWNRCFKKVRLGCLRKVITEERALEIVKSGTFSDYDFIQLGQAYREGRLKKIIKACKLSNADIVHISDEDTYDLAI